MYELIISAFLTLNTPALMESQKTYKTLKECYFEMNEIYKEKKKLKANYPLDIEYKLNDNHKKYLKYTYKPDYTKPTVVNYYQCKKVLM